jgi:hypothetical protein
MELFDFTPKPEQWELRPKTTYPFRNAEAVDKQVHTVDAKSALNAKHTAS